MTDQLAESTDPGPDLTGPHDNPSDPLHGGHPPSRPARQTNTGLEVAEPVERPADWPGAPNTENPDEHHAQADEHPPKLATE